jgi:sarcosine oxidase subunit alpha
MYVADARFFEPGCLIYDNSETKDPTLAVGVFYAPAPGNRSGGLAMLVESIPQGTTLHARDSGGTVAVKVLERVRIGA